MHEDGPEPHPAPGSAGSYEYLDGEIEQLDNLLKGIALTDETP